jgi:hypothetical protein
MAYTVVLLQHPPGGAWSHHQGLNSIATQAYSRSANCTLMVTGFILFHINVTIVSKDKIGLGCFSAQLYATHCI